MNSLENQKQKYSLAPLELQWLILQTFFFPFLLVLLLYLADKKERLLAE